MRLLHCNTLLPVARGPFRPRLPAKPCPLPGAPWCLVAGLEGDRHERGSPHVGPMTSQRPEHVVGAGLVSVGGMATQGPREGQEAWLPTPSCPPTHPAAPLESLDPGLHPLETRAQESCPGCPAGPSGPTPAQLTWEPCPHQACQAPGPVMLSMSGVREALGLCWARGLFLRDASFWACSTLGRAPGEGPLGPSGQSHQGGTPSTPLSLPHVTVEHPPRARLCSGC